MLRTNKPGDEYEQEADRVSERVMRMSEPQLQRACACGGGCPKCQAEQPGQERERLQVKPARSSDLEQTTVPPLVDEVLRSPGQPLDAAARGFMESRFGYDFSGIRIHTDPAAASSAEALGADAYTFGTHIAFGHARFLPGTQQGNHLMAHELTHTIQQARLPQLSSTESGPAVNRNASQHIALTPTKTKGGSIFDGILLGTNRFGREIKVKREVGSLQGYDDRLQAIAVVRLAGADPAVVVYGLDKKWHALETINDFESGFVGADPSALDTIAAGDKRFSTVYAIPSVKGITFWREKVKRLKQTLTDLQARKKSGDDPKAIEQEENEVTHKLLQANETLASFILGVKPQPGVKDSEIQFSISISGRTPGKINIIGSPDKNSPGGGHAPMGGGIEFEEGLASAFWIDLPELDKARAAETMFHEVQHVNDWDFAQAWIKTYRTETGRLFVKSATKPFGDWLNAQVKKGRLTKADVELILMEIGDATAYTEARANVRSFLADLQAGAPELATKALVGYAHALKPKSEGGGGQYGSPAPKSEVVAALVVELKKAYGQMPEGMRKQYNTAVAAAIKEYPSAWISVLQFAK